MQPERIQIILIRIVLLSWATTKSVGWKMWLADRNFPLVPPFEWMNAVPAEAHLLLLLAAAVLMTWLFLQPGRFILIPILLFFALAGDALDQNRWQPWEYLFASLLLIIYTNRKNTRHTITITTFLLAALYFFSGLSKLHKEFLLGSWYQLVLQQLLHFKTPLQSPFLFYLGLLIPATETICGIALLFRPTRKIAAIGLILLHCSIVLLVGPAGLNYNQIIWPWNMGMIALLFFLSFRVPSFSISLPVLLMRKNILPVLLWGLFPLAFYLNAWNAYFSAQLYSGRCYYGAIFLPANKVPPDLQRYAKPNPNFQREKGSVAISLNEWAMGETNVPPSPEPGVFRKIKRAFDRKYPHSGATLTMIRYPYTRKEVLFK